MNPDPCVYGPHSRLLVPDEPLPTHRENGVQRGQAWAMAAWGGGGSLGLCEGARPPTGLRATRAKARPRGPGPALLAFLECVWEQVGQRVEPCSARQGTGGRAWRRHDAGSVCQTEILQTQPRVMQVWGRRGPGRFVSLTEAGPPLLRLFLCGMTGSVPRPHARANFTVFVWQPIRGLAAGMTRGGRALGDRSCLWRPSAPCVPCGGHLGTQGFLP